VDLGLEGRRAIVTGGSRGLGRAIALELAREGADVSICARNDDELLETAEELREETGRTIHAHSCDVTIPEHVEAYVTSATGALGGLDILVNNAGRAFPGNFTTLTDLDWEDDLQVKLFSMIRFTRAALPWFREAGGGRVININSVLGRSPDPTLFATSVNRAACLSLTKTLALQLASDEILVNSVNIGSVKTPQWLNIAAKRAPDLPAEEFFASMAEDIPLGRFGEPEEVAGIVAFLAGSRSGYMTGASIDVSGGAGRYV